MASVNVSDGCHKVVPSSPVERVLDVAAAFEEESIVLVARFRLELLGFGEFCNLGRFVSCSATEFAMNSLGSKVMDILHPEAANHRKHLSFLDARFTRVVGHLLSSMLQRKGTERLEKTIALLLCLTFIKKTKIMMPRLGRLERAFHDHPGIISTDWLWALYQSGFLPCCDLLEGICLRMNQLPLDVLLMVKSSDLGFSAVADLFCLLLDLVFYNATDDLGQDSVSSSKDRLLTNPAVNRNKEAAKLILARSLRAFSDPTNLSVFNESGFMECLNARVADVQVLKQYHLFNIDILLSGEQGEERSACPVEQAIGFQSERKGNEGDLATMTFMADILVPFDTCEKNAIIKRVANRISGQAATNVEAFLQLVGTAQMLEASPSFVQDAVLDLAFSSLDCEGDEEDGYKLFAVAVLIARHMCLEGDGKGVFQNYGHWFQNTFGDSGSCLLSNSSRRVKNFIDFLTRLVPYETSLTFLRAHVVRAPPMSLQQRQQWSDYCHLARTKLYDLNEQLCSKIKPAYSTATCGSQHENIDLSEVQEAVRKFEQTGKISQAVLEVSIFRRSYFVGQFLPSILHWARCVKDDERTKRNLYSFVDALASKGKIPSQIRHELDKYT